MALFDSNNAITRAIGSLEAQDSDAAQAILSMTYDMATGLDKHPAQFNEPFAIEKAKPGESYFTNSPLYRSILTYERQGIYELTKMPWDIYNELPRHVKELLSKAVIQLAQEREAAKRAAKNKSKNKELDAD